MPSIGDPRRAIGSASSVPTITIPSGNCVHMEACRQPLPATAARAQWALAELAWHSALRRALFPQRPLSQLRKQPLLPETSGVLGKPRKLHLSPDELFALPTLWTPQRLSIYSLFHASSNREGGGWRIRGPQLWEVDKWVAGLSDVFMCVVCESKVNG